MSDDRQALDEMLADLEDNGPIPPRREIITDHFTNGPDMDTPGSYVRAYDLVPARGDIHRAGLPAEEAAEARAEWDALDAAITALEPVIGWSTADDLRSRVNALQMAVRMEAIARLVATARSMVDYDIDIFVAPELEEEP